VLELARCEFLTRRENILLLGNSGTGGIRLPFLPTRWSATHTANPSNSRRVRAAAYSSRIAVTGFRRIARCAGR
jgi:hypothetical protein